MSTATPARTPVAGFDAEGDEMFDLDLRIVAGSAVPELTAAATQGDNCGMTDNCSDNKWCQH